MTKRQQLIAAQLALLLGFVLALYGVIAPRIDRAEGQGARVEAAEYTAFVERQVARYTQKVIQEQDEADELLVKAGKSKKSFAERAAEKRKRVSAYEHRVEVDFQLDAKRRAAAGAAGAGSAKTWMLALGVAGLVLFSVGALLLMLQAAAPLAKSSYLIMPVIGLLVGGVGMRAPDAGVPDAPIKRVKKTKRDTKPIVLRATIPLPSGHATLSWGMGVDEVRAAINSELARSTTTDGVESFRRKDNKAHYGFRDGKLTQVGVQNWDSAELDTVFASVPMVCKTDAMQIFAGDRGDTSMLRFAKAAMWFKTGDPTGTKLVGEMRKVCEQLNKSRATTP